MRLAILLALLPSLAGAQQALPCGPRDVIVELLAERWGETRKSVALDTNGAMVEIFASEETRTWTLAVSNPGGVTCIVLTGHAWEAVKEPEGELG